MVTQKGKKELEIEEERHGIKKNLFRYLSIVQRQSQNKNKKGKCEGIILSLSLSLSFIDCILRHVRVSPQVSFLSPRKVHVILLRLVNATTIT